MTGVSNFVYIRYQRI